MSLFGIFDEGWSLGFIRAYNNGKVGYDISLKSIFEAGWVRGIRVGVLQNPKYKGD
jgi:hypothetical protein